MDTTTAFIRPAANGITRDRGQLRSSDQAGRRPWPRWIGSGDVSATVAGDVRVHAVRIHDMGPGSESIVNQVVVYAQATPSDVEAIRSICEDWAVDCANERTIEPLPM